MKPPCLPAGVGLGDMPDAGSVSRLGLRVVEEGGGRGGGESLEESGGERGKDGGDKGVEKSSGGSAPTEQKGAVSKPFVLSEGLPPVPHKLVARILRGKFVDMAELLRDNLEAQRRSSSIPTNNSSSGSNPAHARREVPDLLCWVQCFGIYMAVMASKHPERMRQLLAYQTLIVREARRCGGKGWLAYDSYFRQQVVGDDKADWSCLNQSLYAVTFVAQGERGKGRCCGICLESDHTEEQCALYTPPHKPTSGRRAATERGSSSDGHEPASFGRERGAGRMACFAWNQGDCRFLACKYRHICVRCSGVHRIAQCPLLKGDKESMSQRSQAQSEGR